MTLSRKLIIPFSALGMLLSVLAVLAVHRIERGVQDLGEFHTPALVRVLNIQTDLIRAIEETLAYVVTRNDD